MGHAKHIYGPLLARLWPKVNKDGPTPAYRPDLGPCWIWTAMLGGGGYGQINDGTGPKVQVHRVTYALVHGPIPEGWEVDHLCRVPACVNPSHLEAVTPRENTMRSRAVPAINAARTHCVNGHEFNAANTYLWLGRKFPTRKCRVCRNNRRRKVPA